MIAKQVSDAYFGLRFWCFYRHIDLIVVDKTRII